MSFANLLSDELNIILAILVAILCGPLVWILGRIFRTWHWARGTLLIAVATVFGAVIAGILWATLYAIWPDWALGLTEPIGALSTIASIFALRRITTYIRTGPQTDPGALSTPGTRIFVSYRRLEDAFAVDLICGRLKTHFGLSQVIHDIDDIPAGVDFREYVTDVIRECGLLLAIVGRSWVVVTDPKRIQERALGDVGSILRIATESGDGRVKPVLVSDDQLVEGFLLSLLAPPDKLAIGQIVEGMAHDRELKECPWRSGSRCQGGRASART